MLEWQLREKHHYDVEDILLEHGAISHPRGRIRKWNGPVIVPALKELGHTSLEFENCECSKMVEPSK